MGQIKTTIFILILTTIFSFFSCAGVRKPIENTMPDQEERITPTRTPDPVPAKIVIRPTPGPTPVKTVVPAEEPPEPVEEEAPISSETNNILSLESFLALDMGLRGTEDEAVTREAASVVPMRDPAPFLEPVVEEVQLDISREEGFSIPGWKTSSPEEQGIDSALLADMYDFIIEKGFNYDSIMLIRNGTVVSEATFYPHQPYHRHMLSGLTRSVTALLTGIAVDLKYIKGVDQSIWDFFPEIDKSKLSDNKQKITIRHLLTMTSGFMGGDFPTAPQSFKPIFVWLNLGGTFEELLNRRVFFEPGSRFNFDSFNLQILSEIISRATGSSTEEFAYEYLFKPLGIEHFFWSAQGMANYGGWYLNMSHRDIAKIAQLHLNKGLWEDRQIVSRQWINDTFTPVVIGGNTAFFGYQWSVPTEGVYFLPGMLGQEIGIMADKGYILVTTGFNSGILDQATSNTLIDKYILPALKSDTPLKPNDDALDRLRSLEKIAGRYTGGGTSILKQSGHAATELLVSGKNFFLKNNDFGWNKISFEFTQGAGEMVLNIDNWRASVGLDGRYRASRAPLFNENEPFEVFCKGGWTEKGDFFIEAVYETGVVFTLQVTFAIDSIKIIRKNTYYYRNPLYVLKGLKE